jgi:hypothetical protein
MEEPRTQPDVDRPVDVALLRAALGFGNVAPLPVPNFAFSLLRLAADRAEHAEVRDLDSVRAPRPPEQPPSAPPLRRAG